MSSSPIYTTLACSFSSVYQTIDLSEYFNYCLDNSRQYKEKFKTSDHHILPRWAFPEYSSFRDFPWNKATLYHKDHLKAHFLLWKAWSVAENASPLLLMCNSVETLTDEQLELYQSACEAHGKRVSETHTGKVIRQDTINKLLPTIRSNAESNRNMYYCLNVITGDSVHIPVDEYHANKGTIYKSYNSGKPAWNSGKTMPTTQNMVSVMDNTTQQKVYISTTEYSTNKHLYTHSSKGKVLKSMTGLVLVTEISSGKVMRISREEYNTHPELYSFHTEDTIWINNGKENRRVKKYDVIPTGYVKGRIKFSVTRPIRTCPHCNKTGKGSNMSRYHFDNCKNKH